MITTSRYGKLLFCCGKSPAGSQDIAIDMKEQRSDETQQQVSDRAHWLPIHSRNS